MAILAGAEQRTRPQSALPASESCPKADSQADSVRVATLVSVATSSRGVLWLALFLVPLARGRRYHQLRPRSCREAKCQLYRLIACVPKTARTARQLARYARSRRLEHRGGWSRQPFRSKCL